MRENSINELQGASILTKDFFNRLIRRIESTKPLAGSGIAIEQKENGIEVSIGGAGGGAFSEITLSICKDGNPSTITVLGRSQN